MKALLPCKSLLILFLIILSAGCSADISSSLNNKKAAINYTSRYLVPNQLPTPQTIKSVQLYRRGNVNNPPVIELGSSDKLVLAFDELSDLSGQFRITFTHHNQNWSNSNIPRDWYLEGMNELILGGGTKNRLSQPDYHHYSLSFPNADLQFRTSGNFMLHVSDYSSGIRLFSVPFYVTEEAGEMESWVETTYNIGNRSGAIDQPFSEFIYPDFVEYPEFDLSFYFVQNRFWGDTRKSANFDFTEEDRTRFHLSRDNAFAANYDFAGLNLSTLSVDGTQIIDWQPAKNPPQIILREDILNFTSNPVPSWNSNFGQPQTASDARYASVRFRFQDGGEFSANQGVYLIGDFNQWVLSESNKLDYNENSGYWETSTLIKQGVYTYKYAIKDNSADGMDDLILSDTITRQRQEYTSFVYFTDPDYRYQRLLNVQVFRSDS